MARKKAKRAAAVPASIIQAYDPAVPVEALHEHPDNPRDGDVGVISESFTVNGVYDAIVVQRSTGRVLAGNHRLKAARALGMPTLPVLYVDVDDTEARRILLVDNRSSDRASYLDDKLLELLAAAQEEDSLLGTGYDEDDANEVLERVNAAAAPPAKSSDLLDAVSVTIADPTHEPSAGEVWRVGPHVLIVADPVSDWPLFVPFLQDAERDLLCPFPGPIVALTDRAAERRLVMVQPDTYIAGHILDRYAEVHGDAAVSRSAT